jgi:DNA-binding MarR family transcriptional regulator
MNTTDQPDVVDELLRDWRKAHPELDPAALNVVGRIIVLAKRLEKSVESALHQHELSLGQFDILATLRRHGPRGGLSPSDLLKNVVLSSGGMTARLDKLEEAGLIERKPAPGDRRMLLIELTAKGKRVIDAATATRFAEARRSLPTFSEDEFETLSNLLRRWLGQFADEGRAVRDAAVT